MQPSRHKYMCWFDSYIQSTKTANLFLIHYFLCTQFINFLHTCKFLVLKKIATLVPLFAINFTLLHFLFFSNLQTFVKQWKQTPCFFISHDSCTVWNLFFVFKNCIKKFKNNLETLINPFVNFAGVRKLFSQFEEWQF